MKYVGASSTKLQKGLLGTNVYKTFETCWCPYWQCCYKLIILLWSLNEVQFHRFYLWLFYFQCFEAVSLFQVSKAQDNIQS